jgi:hypothetical protein
MTQPSTSTRSPNRSHERRYFYKYVSPECAKRILETRTLRWSSPRLFNESNDPFDTSQELRIDFTTAELNSQLNEDWASLVERGTAGSVKHPVLAMLGRILDSASPTERAAFANELRKESPMAAPEQTEALNAIRQRWRDVVPTLRFLCLSELNDVASMWLHYADKYKGMVFEFEAIDEIDSCFLVARPVTYTDTTPSIADASAWARCLYGQRDETLERLMEEYQYTKATSWAYELEWRIASRARSGDAALFTDYSFHPRELSRVFFGSKCSHADKTDVLKLLSNGLEHVACCEAIVGGQGKFSFRPHEEGVRREA